MCRSFSSQCPIPCDYARTRHLFGVAEMRDAARRVVINDEEEIVKLHMKELDLTERRMQMGSQCLCVELRTRALFLEVSAKTEDVTMMSLIVLTEPDRITLKKISFDTKYQHLEHSRPWVQWGSTIKWFRSLEDVNHHKTFKRHVGIDTDLNFLDVAKGYLDKCKSWPQARYRHTCVDLGHGCVLILGGRMRVCFDDGSWNFNSSTLCWVLSCNVSTRSSNDSLTLHAWRGCGVDFRRTKMWTLNVWHALATGYQGWLR